LVWLEGQAPTCTGSPPICYSHGIPPTFTFTLKPSYIQADCTVKFLAKNFNYEQFCFFGAAEYCGITRANTICAGGSLLSPRGNEQALLFCFNGKAAPAEVEYFMPVYDFCV
jgi:hypothetical protein